MKTLGLVLIMGSLAAAGPALVVSDTSWKASDNPPVDWAAADCDDSKWGAAKDYGMNEEKWKHYTVDNTFGFASEGNWIWTQGNAGGCLRKRFKAPEKFTTAEMIFVADDTAEIWINGEKVDFYDTMLGYWGYRGCAVIVDVLPWIADGDNTVAVKLVDNGGERGFAAEIRFDGEPLAKPFAAGAKDADFQEPLGKDLFKFHTIDAKGLKELFSAAGDHQQVSVRWLAAAAALGAKDAAGLDKALRAAEDGNERLSERAVRFIDALALKSHADTLVEVLKARPATRSGAFAAAALARLGNDEAVPALEKAASCGFKPTERAAKRTLATLKK
ncbi:MAG: hypothetical protein FD180_3131 [Planctomycetota bacterium]|nr:MAG: hypothetical protein FD180_3131 [Planctomycetota bacterium]